MLANTIELNDKVQIPLIGLGTWQVTGTDCEEAVRMAIKTGYRHIDTADRYGNHMEVAKGIKSTGIERQSLFLTTKIWRDSLRPEELKSNVQRFLEELQTEYIDLLLIHWPNTEVDMAESVIAMDELKQKGVIRSIGISNFTIDLIRNLLQKLENTDISIDNHQFEFHPSLQQEELVNFSMDKLMTVTAYSPIAQGQDLELDVIKKIAREHGVNEGQVVLAWIRQRGIIAIPRSSSKKHIEENFKSLEVELSKEDIKKIDSLDRENRLVRPSWAPF